MQFNPQEITALAQADAAAPRMDLYAFIHKALRAYMVDTLVGLGRVDAEDDLELSQAGARVLQLLSFCRAHLYHENTYVHPAMERHAPGSAAAVEQEHDGHGQAIAALADAAQQALGRTGVEPQGAGCKAGWKSCPRQGASCQGRNAA